MPPEEDGVFRMTAPFCECFMECPVIPNFLEQEVLTRADVKGIHILGSDLRDRLKAHFALSEKPVWVAVQNRGEDDPDQYWIGLAIRLGEPFKLAGSVPGTGWALTRARTMQTP